jgi:hypothetical protein
MDDHGEEDPGLERSPSSDAHASGMIHGMSTNQDYGRQTLIDTSNCHFGGYAPMDCVA